MSEQPHGGTTGRWLKRITQSMSGEPRDLAELIEDLREASERVRDVASRGAEMAEDFRNAARDRVEPLRKAINRS